MKTALLEFPGLLFLSEVLRDITLSRLGFNSSLSCDCCISFIVHRIYLEVNTWHMMFKAHYFYSFLRAKEY